MASKRAKRPKQFHAWECEDHAWDRVSPPRDIGGDSDEEVNVEAPDVWGESAGRQFMNCLLTMHFNGAPVSAKFVCILAHWAFRYRDSTEKPVPMGPADFGYNPNAPNGHFQRHLDKTLGMDTSLNRWYVLDTPVADAHDRSRRIRKIPVNLIHEVLDDEIKETPDFHERLERWIEANKELPRYRDHAVVRDNPRKKVHPVIVYVDAVPHQNRESTYGFWVSSLITNTRHLVGVLRKSDKCQCGCLGWCTLWTFFNYIAWCLTAAAAAISPSRKHNLQPFKHGEIGFDTQGMPLMYPVAALFQKGDESEHCSTMGFPTWKSKTYPCRSCQTCGDTMYNFAGCSPAGLVWQRTTHEDVLEAIRLCEIVLTLNSKEQKMVEKLLVSDKRDDGARGRALSDNLPCLGLLKGDRLEPSPEVPDPHGFRFLQAPIRATFWRRSAESLVRHRNPLWSVPGYTCRTQAYDILHLLYLGVVGQWTLRFLWACIISNFWQVDAPTQLEMDDASMIACSKDLAVWYASLPRDTFSAIRAIDGSRIGTRADQKISVKGSECKGLFFFLCAFVV